MIVFSSAAESSGSSGDGVGAEPERGHAAR